jgi:GGDEF domain-containing protein
MSLSVSAGVAVFPEDGDTTDRLLFTADRRMYDRKFSRSGPRLVAG